MHPPTGGRAPRPSTTQIGETMTRTRLAARSAVTILLALLMTAAVAGCGSKEPDVDPALQSSAKTELGLVQHDGKKYVVGHGIAMTVPAGWTDYAPEKLSTDGTTYEWAVGMPADTRPLPYGVQLSMGIKGKGAEFAQLPKATKELAELAPGYKLIGQGDAEVPGAEDAAYLRFEKDLDLGGTPVHVEQLQLFLKMPGGEVSTLRFISEAGKWKQQMGPAYDSLVVAENESA